MTFTVIMTERAAREMRDAAVWWARERSVGEAERWYEGIWKAIAGLVTLPRRCPLTGGQKGLNYEVSFGALKPAIDRQV